MKPGTILLSLFGIFSAFDRHVLSGTSEVKSSLQHNWWHGGQWLFHFVRRWRLLVQTIDSGFLF